MYRRLMVPLDGSPAAERALPLASRLAEAAGASLHLVLVHHRVPVNAVTVPQVVPADYDASLRQSEESYLRAVATRAGTSAATAVTTALLDGAVAPTLVKEVQDSGTDLVVMTTHGRGPVSRFWMGSVADELVRTLRAPILLVRADAEEDQGMPRRILVPLDGSDRAEQALVHAKALARLTGGGVELIQVVPPVVPLAPGGTPVMPPPMPAGTGELFVESAREYLEQQARLLQAEGIETKTTVAVDPSPAAAIVEVADRDGVDLVTIATHGAGGLRRAVLGSVTDKVLRATRRPLLVVRPG